MWHDVGIQDSHMVYWRLYWTYVVGLLTVHLVGRDVDEALDVGDLGGLEQHMRAEHVGLREGERVTERVVCCMRSTDKRCSRSLAQQYTHEIERYTHAGERTDVRLCGVVHDGVDLVLAHNVVDEIAREDVALRWHDDEHASVQAIESISTDGERPEVRGAAVHESQRALTRKERALTNL